MASLVLANTGKFVLCNIRESDFYNTFKRKDIAFDCFVSIYFFRCGQLESALNEATSHVRTLENKNNLLEREVVSKYGIFGHCSSG